MTRVILSAGMFLLLAGLSRAAEPVSILPAGEFRDPRQPQAAVDPHGHVYVVFGSGDAVYCVTSKDGGQSYAAPVKVGESAALMLGKRRGPRVAATDKCVVVTAIGKMATKGHGADLLAWRSADRGTTWQGPVKVNRVESSAMEGLHGMAAGPDGSVFVVWNDVRDKKPMCVLGAATRDGSIWDNECLVYASPEGSICPCCQPTVSYDPKGGLHVMWRNDLGGARDMYLVSSGDGGKTFAKARKLGDGTWDLNTCPMDGGMLAGTADGQIETIWRRKSELFRCTAGRPEVSLGKGEQGWAATGTAGVYLVWITARPGAVMGLAPGAAQPRKLAERGSDPVVAGAPTGKGPVIAAWEEGRGGAMQLRAVVLHPGS